MGKEPTLGQERLASIVERFSARRVVVLGDLVADQFLYGEISRVSREAPVFILRHERTETVPGGAANCAVNLASLGAQVSLLGTVGEDETGRALVEKLRQSRVETDGIIHRPGVRTTTKVRILAGQAHSTRQQVIRVDYEPEHAQPSGVLEKLRARFSEMMKEVDAAIISDYNYGVADKLVARVALDATRARRVPVLVDSRFSLSLFPNFTSATPNEDEVEQLIGKKLADTESLKKAGAALREQLGYEALLVTRGGRGMMLFEEGHEPLHIEAVGGSEPVDGTGAGDTVIATYALAVASGATFSDAALLANHAGGLVVMKRGTASVSQAEVVSSILHSS